MAAKFFTTIKLGDHQEFTPEGFLVVYDVPIARTGEQLYAAEEFRSQGAELESAEDGLMHVERPADEVFRPETIASANGKAFVNDHPRSGGAPDNVTPENWRHLTMGIIMNARRGTVQWSDTLLADIVVFDKHAIDLIRNQGKREVSCGYSSDYRIVGPGRYVQTNILINHVALVEEARCGARCSIGDAETKILTHDCACSGAGRNKKMKWGDAIKKLKEVVKGKDNEAQVIEVLESVQVRDAEEGEPAHGGGIHIHAGGGEGRTKYTDEALDGEFKKNEERHTAHDARHTAHDNDIAAIKKHLGMGDSSEEHEIEGALKEEAPLGTGDALLRSRDSSNMRDMYQRTVSAAELIIPGMRMHAFDAASKPADSYRRICDDRRKVLNFAVHDSALRVLLDEIRGGAAPLNEQGVTAMKCAQVRDVFFALAAARRNKNNSAAAQHGGMPQNERPLNGGARSLAEINKKHADYYKTH